MASRELIILEMCREFNSDFDKIKSYPLDIGITLEEQLEIRQKMTELYDNTHMEEAS
jgi:hypothetical protein